MLGEKHFLVRSEDSENKNAYFQKGYLMARRRQQISSSRLTDWASIATIIACVIAAIGLYFAIKASLPADPNIPVSGSTPTPKGKILIKVQTVKKDFSPVSQALVLLDIEDVSSPPIQSITGDDGRSSLSVDSRYEGKSGRITVLIDGYPKKERVINIQEGEPFLFVMDEN